MSRRGSTRGWSRHGKETRVKEALTRAEERAKRSPQEQLAVLDARNGKGVGAQKERARLAKLV